MKTTISTFAIIALLATGAMAQRNNGPAYGPGQNDRYPNTVRQGNPHADDAVDAYKIDQIDQLVHLSRQQKKEMKRIENSYDKLASTPSAYRNPQAFQQQKQQALTYGRLNADSAEYIVRLPAAIAPGQILRKTRLTGLNTRKTRPQL